MAACAAGTDAPRACEGRSLRISCLKNYGLPAGTGENGRPGACAALPAGLRGAFCKRRQRRPLHGHIGKFPPRMRIAPLPVGSMRKEKSAESPSVPWAFGAANGALGGIRTHGLPLRSFFQAEAHSRFLCHAMAKIAIKSGGFRRLHYARHFPLRHRLQRMELLKKLHQLANHTFERFRFVFGVVTGVTSDKAAPSAQFMDGAALLFGR